MSHFVDCIRRVRRKGTLPERFRAADVRKACPCWCETTYSNFLPKHRVDNPGGYTAYFERHEDGSYSLIDV